MTTLNYLRGYAPELLARVHELISQGGLKQSVEQRYPEAHVVRTDGALFDYVGELRSRYMRRAEPLSKVAYDNRLRLVQQALGTHTTVSRVQGKRLRSKREIRVASLFKEAPAAFLRMIVVHELAHLKEREHDKALYALCQHMLPDYHQVEFDTRLYLTWLAAQRQASAPGPA
jgi:predicted metal-dependent hydrolase